MTEEQKKNLEQMYGRMDEEQLKAMKLLERRVLERRMQAHREGKQVTPYLFNQMIKEEWEKMVAQGEAKPGMMKPKERR